MNILVTGGAGFIGSHLVDHLLADGHEVVAVDNLSTGSERNISHLYGDYKFKFIEADVTEFSNLSEIFKKNIFDCVFHMAANSDIQKGSTNTLLDYEKTFVSTFQVLRCMKDFEVKKIVFASTSAIYGETSDLLHESYGPLQPVSMYGAGKLASEAFISAFSATYNMTAWITRFPNVVGERCTHGVVFDFIKKLNGNPHKLVVLGDGEQYKPYLYVKELVEGVLFVWKNTRDRINVYNIGVESRTRVREIAAMVIEEMDLDAKIEYTGGDRGWIGDVPEFNYDISSIHKLGWKASRTSNESVREAICRTLGK
jgi:UDP-glucose 4-epimerase